MGNRNLLDRRSALKVMGGASAAALGLRTAHVARPNEHGPGHGEAAPTGKVDFAVQNLEELAEKLRV